MFYGPVVFLIRIHIDLNSQTMKGSKIFYGAATIALAIVGAISSASAHRLTPVYYQSSPNICTRIDVDYECFQSSIQDCQATIGGTIYQLRSGINATRTTCLGNLQKM